MDESLTFAGNNSFNTFHDNLRSNYLNEFREQFSKFENEVWNYGSLRPSEAFKIDLKLPLLVIELFAKLFRLWKDFDSFQKLIKAEIFHQINNSMNEYFGEDVSNFVFTCDVCDRNITVEGNHLKYSYEIHSQDEYHRQVLKNFSYLICPSSTVSIPNKPVNEDNCDDFNGYIVLTKDNYLECSLCDKQLIDEQEAIQHVKSWPHMLRAQDHLSTKAHKMVEPHMLRAQDHLSTKAHKMVEPHMLRAQDHLSTKAHKMVEKCQKILKENQTRVMLLNKDNGEFMCESCDVIGANWNELWQHCRSRIHISGACSPKPSNEEGCDFIVFKDDHYECSLCQCMLKREEIEEHKQNEKHKKKYFTRVIMDEDTDGSTAVLDSGSEYEYNAAFKNNNVYIDINLSKDDCEEFKCILCNKSGKGLKNLDTHCMMKIHRKQKRHIENVSKMYVDCDVDIENDSPIKNLDDLYYCQVCDILMDDEAAVIAHMKEKQHIQSEELNKVLNENGACIKLLTDDPDKLYHCHLCGRSIDGDSNIVGHGNSIRHKQLLNMVKALSRNR